MANNAEGLGPGEAAGDGEDGGQDGNEEDPNRQDETTPEDKFMKKLTRWQKGQNTITLAISVLRDLQLRKLAHMTLVQVSLMNSFSI